MRGSGGADKTYSEGKTYKQRGNYPVGFCSERIRCRERKCADCIKLNGVYTGFEEK